MVPFINAVWPSLPIKFKFVALFLIKSLAISLLFLSIAKLLINDSILIRSTFFFIACTVKQLTKKRQKEEQSDTPH